MSNISRQRIVENQPLRIIDALDPNPSVMHLHPPLDHPSNRARQQNMLKTQHPSGQCRRVVTLEHRHHSLGNQGAMIEFGRDQMHARAMNKNPCGQRAGMRIKAGEGRQQRRMDIDQSSGKMLHETVGEDTHETGEHDQINLQCIEPLDQRGIEGLAADESRRRENLDRQAQLTGTRDAGRIGAAGNDHHHLRRPVFIAAGCGQARHVAAVAGDQNCQFRRLLLHRRARV